MAGITAIKFTVKKNGMVELVIKSLIFFPGLVEPHYGPARYLIFEGFSVDEKGKQHYLDAMVVYHQRSFRFTEYLRRFGNLSPSHILKPDVSCTNVHLPLRPNVLTTFLSGYNTYQVYLLLSSAPV